MTRAGEHLYLGDDDCLPEPRIVRLTVDGVTRHYATWSEKPLEEIQLGEMRPYPALDAAVWLDAAFTGGRP